VLKEKPLNSREIILLLSVVALFLREILQLRRKKWFVQWLSSRLPKRKVLATPKIRQIKPKSEKDCPFCQKERANQTESQVCLHNLSSLNGERVAQLPHFCREWNGQQGAKQLKNACQPATLGRFRLDQRDFLQQTRRFRRVCVIPN